MIANDCGAPLARWQKDVYLQGDGVHGIDRLRLRFDSLLLLPESVGGSGKFGKELGGGT